MDNEIILARMFSLLIRASLKDTWAPGASPRVDLMEHALLSLSRHCLIRYDLGMPFTSIFSSWMKASPTENLSMRYRTVSTFSLSASDRLSYCLVLLCSFWDACNWASSLVEIVESGFGWLVWGESGYIWLWASGGFSDGEGEEEICFDFMLIEWTCPLLSESCRSSGSKAKVFANERAFWALVPSSCNLLSTCLFDKLAMSFTEGLQCIFAFPSSFLIYFTMLSFVSFITFISSFALTLCRSLSSSISRYNVSFSFSRFSNFCFHSSMS